jgi:Ser/Thr protein kinase RdoA (MazF antagonist)
MRIMDLKTPPDFFPVVASVLSPEALVTKILPGYRIGMVSDCQFYSGGFNHTYRIRTIDDSTYYLLAYRLPWRTLDDIQYELDVLCHLKTKGFPAISPIPYKDGNLFCSVDAPEGMRALVLFSEAPGKEICYEKNPGEAARLYGRMVALMHNALDDFDSPHPRFHLDLVHFIDQPLSNIQPFLSHRPDDWNYLQHFGQSLRERILAASSERLELGCCHGDLQGYHANSGQDGTLTFFDFDCGGFGYRAYDLAVFLWCCRLEDAVETRWDAYLDGYRETRNIDEHDVRAVTLFVCARYLWHMGVHTQNSPDWGIDFLNDGYFDRHLKDLRAAEIDYFLDK